MLDAHSEKLGVTQWVDVSNRKVGYARLDLIVTVMNLTILSRSVMLFDCIYKLNLESVSKQIIFYLPDFSKIGEIPSGWAVGIRPAS